MPVETGDVSRYEYDQVGNPVKVYSPSAVAKDATNPTSAPTSNSFTANDLLATAEQPPGTGGSRQRISYRYDADSRKLEQATSRLAPADPSTAVGTPAGTQNFDYDPAGRIVRPTGRQESSGGGPSDDRLGLRRGRQRPDGHQHRSRRCGSP